MGNEKNSELHSGFSERFNYLLDKAGYPGMNQGRLTMLSEDEAMSMSGVRNWVVENIPPKASKLLEICERLLNEKIKGSYNPKRVAGWLEYGDEVVPNPFVDADSIKDDHIVMGKIYVLVHQAAKKLSIDINLMAPSVLDKIYKTIMEDVVVNGLEKPTAKLIESLLIIADKDKRNNAKKKEIS